MNSDLMIDKVKNTYHFLRELRELEEKYGLRITKMKKATGTANFDLYTNINGYVISAPVDDVRPNYDVNLKEI